MRISLRDLPDVFRLLAFGIKTNGILGSVDALILSDKKYKDDWEYVKNAMADTRTFSDAIKDRNLFDRQAVVAIEAAQNAGKLESTFKTLASAAKQLRKTRNAISSSLLMPGITILIVSVAVVFLYEFLFPTFLQTPAGNDPAIQFGAQIGNWVNQNHWVYAAVVVLEISMYQTMLKSRLISSWLTEFCLKMPVLGNVVAYQQLGRWARFVSILSDAGVPIISVFETLSPTVSRTFSQGIALIQADVQESSDWNKACNSKRWQSGDPRTKLPGQLIATMQSGGESGDWVSPMSDLADSFEEYYEDGMDKIAKVIQVASTIIVSLPISYIMMTIFGSMANMMGGYH